MSDHTGQQRGDLLTRPHLRQAVQQPAHGVSGIEADVSGRVTSQQRGDLPIRPYLPQPLQQPAHGVRVIEGDVNGSPVGGTVIGGVQRVYTVDKGVSGGGAVAGGVLEELGGVAE